MKRFITILCFVLVFLTVTSGTDTVNAKRHYPKPTPTPVVTPSPTPVVTPSPTLTITPRPTVSPTPTPSPTPSITPSPTAAPWTFSDEFNAVGLSSKWQHNYSCCGSTTMDRALTTQPGDGYLHQKIVKKSDGRWYADIIDTRNTFTQTYGYFEARMKIPKGKGIWPAFWLYNGTFGTDGDEIDIQEVCANPAGTNGGNDVTFLHQTVHKGTQSNQLWNPNGRVGDLSLDWHVYAVDWRPTYVAFYLDGVMMWKETTMLITTSKAVLLNLGVGGSWCSAPDATTPSGAEMLVDWVRVRN